MKRLVATVLALVSVVLTGMVVAAPASAGTVSGQLTAAAQVRTLETAQRLNPPTEPPPAPATTSPLQRVLEIVNAERAARGLPPMRMDSRLNQAAQLHSQDQAARKTMSHVGSDGSRAGDRITRTGYVWRSWGENVAAGYGTAESVMAAWMNSPGHRANILSGNTEIGLGLAYASNGVPYWTQVFATPR